MKIGIITWFHYENYGTILQALALQKYLASQGHQPELIDIPIIPTIPYYEKKKGGIKELRDKVGRKIQNIYISKRYSKQKSQKSQKFHDTIYDNVIVTKVTNEAENFVKEINKYNAIICGSDQIWNPNWYNDYYFANFSDITSPKISYAPSLGVSKIPAHFKGTYYDTLKKFSALSVREKDAQQDIINSYNLDCSLVVDPVLLLNEHEWSQFTNTITDQDDYVLCYFLSDNKSHWKAARKFAKSQNLKLKIIVMTPGAYTKSGSKFLDAGPLDFISLIKNAKYVVTDSFHASVFSLIFKKSFYIFERTKRGSEGSQNSRIYNLLSQVDLENRLVPYNSSNIIQRNRIDYRKVSNLMQNYIDSSIKYLKEALDNSKEENAKRN